MEKNKVDQYNFVINQSETRFATEDYRANEASKRAIYSDPSSHFLWFHVGTFWQFPQHCYTPSLFMFLMHSVL